MNVDKQKYKAMCDSIALIDLAISAYGSALKINPQSSKPCDEVQPTGASFQQEICHNLPEA